MFHFCTIGSGNYLPFIETLYISLKKQTGEVRLHALLTDTTIEKPVHEGLFFYTLDDIAADELTVDIVHQFKGNNNHLRWALKPAFLHFLLKTEEQVIYVDNDISFFTPYDFLFEQLSHHGILLTPHWFCLTPYPQPENFKTNFQIGLFNAGFIGATKKGQAFLKWWAQVCLYRMERNIDEGFYDDQRYLDMSMLVDDSVGIVRHKGCNVGSWNMHQNKRVMKDGNVLINGTDPIVFIHFNHETIKHILNGNDKYLKPYFKSYESTFAETGYQLETFISQLPIFKEQTFIQLVARKTKLRTRIKSWLFRLSQKL